MTDQPNTESFLPDEDCTNDPAIGGDPRSGCALTETCTLRCHLRWLDGQHQPNDAIADKVRGNWLTDRVPRHQAVLSEEPS